MNICVIVPNELDEYINKKIDETIAMLPMGEQVIAQEERAQYYNTILEFWHQTGNVPETIALQKKTEINNL